jgi:hypothetical protein
MHDRGGLMSEQRCGWCGARFINAEDDFDYHIVNHYGNPSPYDINKIMLEKQRYIESLESQIERAVNIQIILGEIWEDLNLDGYEEVAVGHKLNRARVWRSVKEKRTDAVPMVRDLDGTLFAYKCPICLQSWKIYQSEYHTPNCPASIREHLSEEQK